VPGRTTSAAAGSRGTDPVVPAAGFGRLPGPSTGGFTWSVTPGGDFTVDDENGTVEVSLTLQTVGEPEPQGPYTPGGTVDGHPAVWAPMGVSAELVWQYEPGAWARLSAEGASNAEATRIADSVQFGGQHSIAMLFHLPALPTGFTVVGARAIHNTQLAPVAGGGALTLRADGGGCSAKDGGVHDELSLSAYSGMKSNPFGGAPAVALRSPMGSTYPTASPRRCGEDVDGEDPRGIRPVQRT
jgi:hypothetical protein